MYRPRRLPPGHRRARVAWCSVPSMLLILVFLIFNVFLWLPFPQRLQHVSDGEGDAAAVAPPSTTAGVDANAGIVKKMTAAAIPVPRPAPGEGTQGLISLGSLANETRKGLQDVEESPLLRVYYTRRSRLWTLKAIVEKVGYKQGVTPTICPPLPGNVTIPIEEPFEIGMMREFVGGMYHPVHCRRWERYDRQIQEEEQSIKPLQEGRKKCSEYASWDQAEVMKHVPKYAYVMMVSNHRYLDGAMVLADSIRRQSPLSRNGGADIVLMISEHIKKEMFVLLQAAFDRVMVFHGLQQWAPKSAYQATFDKMYLYMLEDYTGGIVFLDADSLITDNPDFLLKMPESIVRVVHSTDPSSWTKERRDALSYPLAEHEWKRLIANKTVPLLFAVGDDAYFQTGLMILQPSLKVFLDLYLEFRLGSYGYNRWQARDGLLFRACFNTIGEMLKRPRGVYHFTGTPKPWFNLERLDHSLQVMGVWMRKQLSQSWRDNANRYEWWTLYESLHVEVLRHIEMETRKRLGPAQDLALKKWRKKYGSGMKNIPAEVHITKYGGAVLLRKPTVSLPLPLGLRSVEEAEHASPNAYMWLMRFSKAKEYLHPTRAHVAKLRIGTTPIASADELHLLLSPSSPPSFPLKAKMNGSVAYAFAAVQTQQPAGDEEEGGGEWHNCETSCAKLQLQCDVSLLLDTRIADCQHGNPVGTMANGLIRCKRCLPHFKAGAPFVLFQKHESNGAWIQEVDVCFFNAWTRFSVPQCNASKPHLKSYELKKGDLLVPVCACR
ncbi:putative glycogenin glucosyltransferase [Trypanosoma grayi]|uniref:putative glycogenin glucosyltransferase n=1 Tax=Trypanosoma grayi TaxID=71804 RepID=UPI0004F45CF1|nr:putative glycogenin glucosyltransferase [Trypanosoma grayi]KEG08145.1 putative glycogenin glucosyltransferase [Trypanosoma grayi]